MILLEDLCHWGWAVSKALIIPSYLSLPSVRESDVSSQLLTQNHACLPDARMFTDSHFEAVSPT